MSESLIIFSREWTVTAALRAYLAPVYFRPVMTMYDFAQLRHLLREQPQTPLILGLNPHEHVADLYRLQSLLAGRAVLFVGRRFYWTDYNLPEWLGLEQYGFCTWNTLHDPFSRRKELRYFRQLAADTHEEDNIPGKAAAVSSLTEMQILEKANRWLYRELSVAGLNGFEIRVLSLMTDGLKGNLSSRTRSLYKNNGLYKLGMTKHVLNLFRGVKVRPELQACLHCPARKSGRKEKVMEVLHPKQISSQTERFLNGTFSKS
ncbi:hypothetical protein CJ745_24745 [Salmonella enterica subsp. enterica]|uniref:Uncharacterized protein n=1 Tax=Salmonella enterica TaxID=28901 RepID=A0A5U4CX97_SALER|nr:hypothetical protein [Salmonella enterica subsp. enterica]EBP8539832.1 hypothetical protein [Salmonella enterica]EBT4152156.1 hypothetical protein [Salmonella enterica subsp. enterica]EED9464807.1 hypothetical protein [Salmonella enterica subsp. enterica serovar Abaetetuba]